MGSGDGENKQTNKKKTEVGDQGVKGKVSVLKIHIAFIVLSSGLRQTVVGFLFLGKMTWNCWVVTRAQSSLQ